MLRGRLRTCTSAALGRPSGAAVTHARHKSAASWGQCSGTLDPLASFAYSISLLHLKTKAGCATPPLQAHETEQPGYCHMTINGGNHITNREHAILHPPALLAYIGLPRIQALHLASYWKKSAV